MATVLVVDDDPQARTLLQGTLVALGHRVLLAPDGEVALTLYDQAEPDLVITDLVMPVLNGVLLIEHGEHGSAWRAPRPGVRRARRVW